MARYIDADLLRIEMEELYEHHIEMRNFSADGAVADCLTMLNNAPTADVAEVKHGEWQRQKNGFYFVCSVCGKAAATKGNYCHSCGAKMDKENTQ